MSRADGMFKELGYERVDLKDRSGCIWGIGYKNHKIGMSILLDLLGEQVCTGTLDDEKEPIYITMQELQAINEKCKELGWFEWAEQ